MLYGIGGQEGHGGQATRLEVRNAVPHRLLQHWAAIGALMSGRCATWVQPADRVSRWSHKAQADEPPAADCAWGGAAWLLHAPRGVGFGIEGMKTQGLRCTYTVPRPYTYRQGQCHGTEAGDRGQRSDF